MEARNQKVLDEMKEAARDGSLYSLDRITRRYYQTRQRVREYEARMRQERNQ